MLIISSSVFYFGMEMHPTGLMNLLEPILKCQGCFHLVCTDHITYLTVSAFTLFLHSPPPVPRDHVSLCMQIKAPNSFIPAAASRFHPRRSRFARHKAGFSCCFLEVQINFSALFYKMIQTRRCGIFGNTFFFSGNPPPTITPYVRVPSPHLNLLPQTHDFNVKTFKALQACCVLLWVLSGGKAQSFTTKG